VFAGILNHFIQIVTSEKLKEMAARKSNGKRSTCFAA